MSDFLDIFDAGDDREAFFRQTNVPSRPARYEPPLFGGAHLASESDLASLLNGVNADVPSFDDVSILTEVPERSTLEALYCRQLYLDADIRRRGILAVGPPGSGKTERLVFPLMVSDIRDPNASLVVVCTKGDLEHKLRPFMERYRPGVTMQVLNFSAPHRTTHAYNPLAQELDAGQALQAAEDYCAAAAAERPGHRHDSPFWDQNAARFIVALQLILRKQNGSVCPADVHRAAELPHDKLLKLLAENCDADFAAACHAFLSSGSQNAETVMATVQGHLRRYCDGRLAATTSINELSLEQLFRQPSVLVIEVRQTDLALVRPIINTFLSRLLDAAFAYAETQPGNRLPRPLCLYFDDFVAALGKIARYASYANLLRSRDIRVTAAVQTLRQFTQAYDAGEDDAVIAAFGSKVFLSGVDPFDARWASEQSGTMTVEREDRQDRPLPDDGELQVFSRSIGPAARPLLLPDEVRLAPNHFLLGRAATVFLPDLPPFQAWFRPAYDTPGLAELLRVSRAKPRIERLRLLPLVYGPSSAARRRAADPIMVDATALAEKDVLPLLAELKRTIGWEETTGTARKWWEAFETENSARPRLILMLVQELAKRKATITEFFLCYIYSDIDNIQGNLHYLDYRRIEQTERKQKLSAPAKDRRFQTGQACPQDGGGFYRFDGWLKDKRRQSTVKKSGPDEDSPAPIEVRAGQPFPLHPLLHRPCWWVADSAPGPAPACPR